MSGHRLMFVYVHPNNESSQSPATISHYVDEGARVMLVIYMLDELGEILAPEWEYYAPEELGVRRMDELVKMLKIVDVTDHVWLGDKGRYRDSGMATSDEGQAIPRDELPGGAFWAADLLEIPNHLITPIRDCQLQVIVTYDQNGDCGRPDHIQVHHVTMYATMLAGVLLYQSDLGELQRMSQVLWINPNPQAWSKAVGKAHELGMPLPEGMDEETMRRRFAIDPCHIATVTLYEGCANLCQAVPEAHRSQMNPENPLRKVFRSMCTVRGTGETYRLAAGVLFPDDGPADDLFADFDV